jgi:proteasome lid subunit RPN8/RPN11
VKNEGPAQPRGCAILTISHVIVDKIIEHARQEHPNVACGFVVGPAGEDRPDRFIPMLNTMSSPTFWAFDSAQLLQVHLEMDRYDEEPVLVYRSYEEARPGKVDVQHSDPLVRHQAVVSVKDPDNPEFRSYVFEDGEIVEEEVVVERLTPQDLRQRLRRRGW